MMRRKVRGIVRSRWVGVAGLLLSCLPPPASAASVTPVKVIVNPSVSGKNVKKLVVGEIFLGRVARWNDGGPITPVDLSLTSPVRLGFIRGVLGLSALDVHQYWVRELSRGRVPPSVKKSEDDVIAFVASTPGAIGYVAETTPTPDTVKVLTVD